MVKWTSSRASNAEFRVRVLVGLLDADVADTERHRSCKPDHAGANPVVGSIGFIDRNRLVAQLARAADS